jgi:hypothetical protein
MPTANIVAIKAHCRNVFVIFLNFYCCLVSENLSLVVSLVVLSLVVVFVVVGGVCCRVVVGVIVGGVCCRCWCYHWWCLLSLLVFHCLHIARYLPIVYTLSLFTQRLHIGLGYGRLSALPMPSSLF